MPNEQTSFEAVRNRLLNKAREHDEKAKQLRHAAQSAEDALRLANGEDCEAMAPKPRGRRGSVAASILEWAALDGRWERDGFTPHEARDGMGLDLEYNNVYEALRRMMVNGQIVREGPEGAARFYRPGCEPSKRGQNAA
jgi:hypothetical protein